MTRTTTSKTRPTRKPTMEQRLLKVAKSFGVSKMRTASTIKAEAVYYGAQDLLGNAISLEVYRNNKNGNGSKNGNGGNKFDWNEWKELFPKILGFTVEKLMDMIPEQQVKATRAIANLTSKYINMGSEDPVEFIVKHNEKKREEMTAQKNRKIFIDEEIEDDEISLDEDFDETEDDEDFDEIEEDEDFEDTEEEESDDEDDEEFDENDLSDDESEED